MPAPAGHGSLARPLGCPLSLAESRYYFDSGRSVMVPHSVPQGGSSWGCWVLRVIPSFIGCPALVVGFRQADGHPPARWRADTRQTVRLRASPLKRAPVRRRRATGGNRHPTMTPQATGPERSPCRWICGHFSTVIPAQEITPEYLADRLAQPQDFRDIRLVSTGTAAIRTTWSWTAGVRYPPTSQFQ